MTAVDDDRGATGEALADAVNALSEDTRKRLAKAYQASGTADIDLKPRDTCDCGSRLSNGGWCGTCREFIWRIR